jgi:hypothetical protein
MKVERIKKRMPACHLLAIPMALAGSAACSEPVPKEPTVVQERSEHAPVAGLPFSQGRTFTSLDEYLAFLEKRGAVDVPWYREIRPGVYELVSRRRPGTEPQIFTRAELARKFGFAE